MAKKKRGTTCIDYVLHFIYLSHAACEVEEKQTAPKSKKQEKDTVKTSPKKKRGK